MNKIHKILSMSLIFACFGCAGGQMRQTQEAAQANQRTIAENEARINDLENSVASLNNQIAQLNNRVYEVRTRTGQKTSMTVVPVIQAKTASSSVAQGSTNQPPVGKKIDPNAKTVSHSVQKAAGKANSSATPAQKPASVAANNQSTTLPGLPPTDLPAPSITSQNSQSSQTLNANNPTNPVPVPNLYESELSLPPEQTVTQQPAQTQAPAVPQQVAQTAQTSPIRGGEEAAYNAALKTARSGRIPEAIPMFENFIRQYPNSRYTANADYWLGECLYAQGKLQEALSQFQTVNNTYPTHHKNADALLKAGMTLSKMGDNAAAQEKYRNVLTAFPNSDAAKRVRAMGIR